MYTHAYRTKMTSISCLTILRHKYRFYAQVSVSIDPSSTTVTAGDPLETLSRISLNADGRDYKDIKFDLNGHGE